MAPGSLAAVAEAVGRLIDRIGGPVHLVGHSYGGAVALKLASQRPADLRSLTVIEPAAFQLLRVRGPAALRRGHGHRGGDERRRRPAVAAGGDAALHRLLERRRRLVADQPAAPGSSSSPASTRCAPTSPPSRRRPDGPDALARIDCPALAVMALDSPAASLRATELVAEALPRAVLRLIPDAGHMAPLTDPHVVDPMIAAHLVAADRVVRLAPAIAA